MSICALVAWFEAVGEGEFDGSGPNCCLPNTFSNFQNVPHVTLSATHSLNKERRGCLEFVRQPDRKGL